ncbi:hypothetical protein PUN28_015429 [Cardiocondyla obscurior]|uniref:Uncharacterized protein n=2 Tax=Cardiocondyla obscurior TaxID=286306 RepID=A0AAW2EY14_9HYME
MSADRESSNLTERCRICLVDHGCMTSLQSNRVEIKLKDLIKCTCIDIKYEENLPAVICHVCLYKLNMWSEFKERFIQSNKVLLEQLEISEVSDNVNKDSSQSGNCVTNAAKRKHKNNEDKNSDTEQKKIKIDVSSSQETNDHTNQYILDTIYISSDDESNHNNTKDNGKQENSGSGPTKARLLPAKRGRNIERRKASTKRWVERKKALLAATGENVSDTDSIGSDDVQLSPVQKARAKTNVDKELERQKKVARVLKGLETNLTDKYVALSEEGTNSDVRRTRLSSEQQSNTSQQRNRNSLLKQVTKRNIEGVRSSLDSSMERENSISLTDNVMCQMRAKNSIMQTDQTFTPSVLKSTFMIDDITYAVTSTLSLMDPSNHEVDLNNLTVDSKNPNIDENNRETNTDIIDAVQLRRIHPLTMKTNDNNDKYVERCLTIEVQNDNLPIMKRIQSDVASFVEKEMKNRIFSLNDDIAKTDKTNGVKTSTTNQKLDQRVKEMIIWAIKNNFSTLTNQENDDESCSQGSTTFSPTSAKTVINSPKYQPKVILERLDVEKESKHYKINNDYVLKPTISRSKLAGPFSVIARKRQSIPPIRYNDYNVTSLTDSDSEALDDDTITQKTSGAINSKTNLNPKELAIFHKSVENKINQNADRTEGVNTKGATTQNHICGVCGLSFSTRKDAETHVRTHKVSSVMQNNVPQTATSPQKSRQGNQKKVMRCRRCHEIVETRLVKNHVCKMPLHKCYVCDSMFRTKNHLAKHLESHDNSKFNVISTIGNKLNNNASALKKTVKVQETETAKKIQTLTGEKNDIQSDKISSTGVKLESTESILKKPKETYTCFVCDTIFTDEEVLKDHLQKHCDDLSEGEQSNSKEQYQCAICGNTLESDQALEEHVGKHLFDDEDDNPNLISIDQGNENNKLQETYHCGQCLEAFESEMLLEIHMQAHEEEVAIAEWEKQGMMVYQYQCMLCDELFNTQEELAKHLDIHNANTQICQLCDKPFRSLEDLQEHVATH